jgi:4-diphosphocytidyl-2-C-methyl-D-erythritol kinase
MTDAPRRVTATAPGKVNVTLSVGEVADDGYHPLATLFMALNLVEQVEAREAETLSLRFAPGPIDTEGLEAGEGNLAIRAARLLAEFTGRAPLAELVIRKQVPIAGGMGGGSADAAATLVALDALGQTNLTREDLADLGAKLGSDVPFALFGNVAVGTGRGTELAPTLAGGTFEWVLRLSDEGMSTPATYRALDEHRAQHASHLFTKPVPVVPQAALLALRSGDPVALADAMQNDLQAPALRLRPDLVEALEFGEGAGALAGIVSGSGPTLAFLAADAAAADALAEQFRTRGDTVVRANGPSGGARILAD